MNELVELGPADHILVVMAHPDDVDFGAAGSIAKWVELGSKVTYVVVTDGDAGGFDKDVPRDQIPSIRREEQRAAASVVGVDKVEFLGYKDGSLVQTPALVRDISRMIRKYRPDRVLCQSPERNYLRVPASHPDHRTAGSATLDAVYPYARNPFAFPELLEEGLEAFIVKEVILSAHPEANSYVEVTDTFAKKVEAILCHQSQNPNPSGVEPMVRKWLESIANLAGLRDGGLAEGFFRITI